MGSQKTGRRSEALLRLCTSSSGEDRGPTYRPTLHYITSPNPPKRQIKHASQQANEDLSFQGPYAKYMLYPYYALLIGTSAGRSRVPFGRNSSAC